MLTLTLKQETCNCITFVYFPDEDGNSHFNMRFLGSVEVSGHKGDDVLCQAINKVRHQLPVYHVIIFNVNALVCCIINGCLMV